MFKIFLDKFKNLDELILKITKYGFKFSFVICIISALILFTYETIYKSPDLYYIGLSLFKTSLIFAMEFIICAIGFDTIKKQIMN